MVYTDEKIKCPICFHVLKYLYERVHTRAIGKTGREYGKHVFNKRAYYCKYCSLVYPLDLQQTVDDLKNLI